jgi:hypothetical protein
LETPKRIPAILLESLLIADAKTKLRLSQIYKAARLAWRRRTLNKKLNLKKGMGGWEKQNQDT